METSPLEINAIKYPVKVFVEKRRNAKISMRKRSINIRVPRHLSYKDLEREILSLKAWATQKILENPERFKPPQQKKYVDGQELRIGNAKYILKIAHKETNRSSARMHDGAIHLHVSSRLSEEAKHRHVSTLIRRCVARKMKPALQKRIDALNALHFNQKINRVVLKYNRSNWGSCSSRGNINISTRLLLAPDSVMEYICIHELAHLVECNHSDRFWSLVENAMPDYKEKEKWLKANGDSCEF